MTPQRKEVKDRDKRIIAIAAIFLAVGLLLSGSYAFMTSYPDVVPGSGESGIREITGSVETVELLELQLLVDGETVEVHGPAWVWNALGIREDDLLTVKGVYVTMTERGEGLHAGWFPYELTVNETTYGNADTGLPLWLQNYETIPN
jgi:hypothetical protein